MSDVERLQREMKTRLEIQGRALRADIARLRSEGNIMRVMLVELGMTPDEINARVVAALLEQARHA